ncbi:ribosomal L1 domain-containing protein 1 isoform X1 [Brachionichthys hirsutus]|uniref:ribosomal L1 domain-containing protein 1 isoform X1 n=1 Tax=Brachionichthys hirsutus TaxID=412623 RepID=UPI0036050977
MAEQEPVLDRVQVKKAVQALQAFLKTRSTKESLFPDDAQPISVLFTFWRIPKEPQTIRIPLPHGQRTDTEEVCLFTRDEPKMTPEQTQRFYKKLLEERGVKNITEVIPYKVLKTEYKPFEAKRRLLGNFAMFVSDDRIRRLLPSHLGKHFYLRKKEPLTVNLQSKQLARDIQRLIQGTNLKINSKGSCCMARVAHSGMSADEVTENIAAAVQTVTAKMRMKGPVMKVIHIKSMKSVALPIYTSNLSNYGVVEEAEQRTQTSKEQVRTFLQAPFGSLLEDGRRKRGLVFQETARETTTEDAKQSDATAEEEEIPQLVPIVTPTKEPKVEKPLKKKRLARAPGSAALTMETRMQTRRSKSAKDPKVKRKAPKAK